MLDIPREIVFLVFTLGIAVFALSYISLTVTWGQRSPLLWMLIPLVGGIGIGLGKGESIDVLLFSLGGFFLMLPFLLLLPRGKRKELNRREAAGEKVDWQEAAPPTWAVLVFAGVACLWAVFSFIATGG
ncbi:hypothetical protein ACFY7Z_02860 [Streptomyces sp. NPDC012623]|uniref:hypothetical protein n=1 Tax=unclassified Streptomyces TaxID=2593676 RepID=UPI003693D9D6